MLNFKLCWFGDCDVDFADWIGNAGLFGKRVPSIASPALSLSPFASLSANLCGNLDICTVLLLVKR